MNSINESLLSKHSDLKDALERIQDPEIPINIYQLGLIREVNLNENYQIDIKMTLTNPNCPVADALPEQLRIEVEKLDWVKKCTVSLTWEPAWSPNEILEEGKMILEVLGLDHVLKSGSKGFVQNKLTNLTFNKKHKN